MTINYSKQVLVKRGNTEVSSTYIGPLGEITLDTDLHQLRLHDGETAGGWLVPSGQDFTNITANISALQNIDVQELANIAALLSNAVSQETTITSLVANAASQQTQLDNLVTTGNTDPLTDNETLWFNTDEGRMYIKDNGIWVDANPTVLPSPSYIYNQLQDVVGDIIPSETNTYSLGSETAQWKDLWVSNATIYLDSVPLSTDVSGNITFNGNPLVSYTNGNLTVGGAVVSGGGSPDSITDGYYQVLTDGTGIHLNAGDISLTYDNNDTLTFTGLNPTVKFDNNFKLFSPGYDKTWLFNYSGQTLIPGDLTGNSYLSLGSSTFTDLRWYNTNPVVSPGNKLQANVRATDEGVRITNRYINGSSQAVYNHWLFDFNGNLTIPGAIQSDTGIIRFTPNTASIGESWSITDNFFGEGSNSLVAPQSDDQNIGSVIFPGSTNIGQISLVGNIGSPFDNGLVVGSTGNVAVIAGNSNYWKFRDDGALTLPDEATIIQSGFYAGPGQNAVLGQSDGNTQIYTTQTGIGLQTYNAGTYYTWGFDNTGSLTLPGSISGTSDAVFGHTTVGEFDANGEASFAANVEMFKDLYVHGNINFGGNVIQNTLNVQQGIFTGNDAQTGFGALYAGIAQLSYTFLPSTVFQMQTNSNEYTQMNYQNLNGGNQASADYVITADNGNDTQGFIDMGLAGSGWDGTQPNSLGSAVLPNDGYIYVQNGTGTAGGNLILGATSPNKTVNILAGGTGSGNIVASFGSTGVTFRDPIIGNITGSATSALTATAATYVTNLTAANITTALGYTPTLYNDTNVAAYLSGQGITAQIQVDWNQSSTGNIAHIKNKPDLTVYATNTNVQTISANLGSFQTWSNANVVSLQNQITGANTNIQTFNANLGAYQTYANATFSVSTYSNTNVAAYLTTATINTTGNITGNNLTSTSNLYVNGGHIRTSATTANVFNNTATSVYIAGGATIGTYIGNANGVTQLYGNVQGSTNGFAIGYRDIPQITFAASATITTSDAGKHYYSTSSSNLTLTVANNATASFSIGAAINVVNQGTGNITISPGSGVTMYLAGNSTSGLRTLSSYGVATLQKVATDTWFVVGVGLT